MAKKVSKEEFKHTMSRRMVDVSQTTFDAGAKRVRGAGGKLFTGAVDLGGGKTATYEKGRRLKVSGGMKGFRNPPSSKGSAKTSTSTPVVETKTLPPTRTNTVGSGYTSGSYRSSSASATPPASGSSRLEGPRRSMPAGSGRSQVKFGGTSTGEQRRAAAMKQTSGFVRGTRGSTTAMNRPKGSSLSGALQRKRVEDTRNQVRNAVVVGSLPLLAAGGAKAVAATVGARLAGRVAAEQIAARAGQIRASAQAAASKPAAAPKAAPKPAAKPAGTTKGVSKVSGGALKAGQPAKYGPRKPTAAQMAQSRRQTAARKAAATRRANAAKTARGRKKP